MDEEPFSFWSSEYFVSYFQTNFGVCIKATGKQVSSPSLGDVCLQFSRQWDGNHLAASANCAKSVELFRFEDFICEVRIAGETCQC